MRKARRDGKKSLAWPCLCIAPYSRSPLTSLNCFSFSRFLFPSLSRSPSFHCPRPFPSIVVRPGLLRDVMRLRCANDRAADIGNYSLRNSRAPPTFLSPLHLLSPSTFVSCRLSCPSCLVFLLLLFLFLLLLLDTLSYVLVKQN